MAGAPRRPEDPRDLGFGSVVTRESRRRLLNRDGTFNVVRRGLSQWARLSPYHAGLTLSWPRFLAGVALAYFGANLAFALLYLACGPAALEGGTGTTVGGRFLDAFFFSVQTLATIGYGRITAVGLIPNLIVTIEALTGLLGFALATGLVFARFSRPSVRVVFSAVAVVAPYGANGTGRGLMLRIVNARSQDLIEVEAKVLLARRKPDGNREFLALRLERERVQFFPLAWTIVHPIDESSPLAGVGPEDFEEQDGEILVLLSATDETYEQKVHTRSSYRADEVLWNQRFASIFLPPAPDGRLAIDIDRLSEVEAVER